MAAIDLTDSEWTLIMAALREKSRNDSDISKSHKVNRIDSYSDSISVTFAQQSKTGAALANKIEDSY